MTIVLPPLDIHKIRIVPLASRDVLTDFESGEREIDRALDKCCDWQDKHRVRMFCAMIDGCDFAYGFYSLGVSAADSKYMRMDLVTVGDERSYIPFLYLNYLAVRREFHGQKLGTLLLMNALTRCEQVARNVGVYGVALNALNDRAAGLYDRYGFRAYDKAKYPFMILPIQSLFDLM